jgi:hypothetical protein
MQLSQLLSLPLSRSSSFARATVFFEQNLENIRLYRRAGLEYVDIMRAQAQQHAALSRQLSDIRSKRSAPTRTRLALEKFDQFATQFSDAGDELNALVSDANDQALALREASLAPEANLTVPSAIISHRTKQGLRHRRSTPLREWLPLRSAGSRFAQISDSMKAKIDNLLAGPPSLTSDKARRSFEKWKTNTQAYLTQLPPRRRSFVYGLE